MDGWAILCGHEHRIPDARASVKSAVELINHRPFFGEWRHVERRLVGERSRLESDGRYVWGAGASIGVQATVPQGAPAPEEEYVIFERMGREWDRTDSDPDLPSIPVVPWRTTPISPAWRPFLGQAEDG